MRDDSGSVVYPRVNIPMGTTVAESFAAADTWRSLVSPLSDAVFVSQAVHYPAVEMSPADPSPASNATVAGILIFNTATAGEYAIVEIPGIREEFIIIAGEGAGVQLDTEAPAIADLVTQLVSGAWCNPWGFQLTALAGAMVQIRP